MTRTEPVAAFSVTGIVTGLVIAVADRYAPGVEIPPELLVLIVGGIVAFARQWVVPHEKAVNAIAAATREVARLRTERGNRHQSETPPKPGVRA